MTTPKSKISPVTFPLYDDLYNRALTKTELPDFKVLSSTINGIDDPNHAGIIYALMIHHERKHDPISFTPTPFKGVINKIGKGVSYQVHNIPALLLKIINEYLILISVNQDRRIEHA